MEAQYTGIALAEKDGDFFVLHDIDAERWYLKNEKPLTESGYVSLVNATNLADLMLAYELVRFDDHDTMFVSDFYIVDPQPVTYESIPTICALFGDESPTRTTVAKMQDVIDTWSIEHLGDRSGEKFLTSDGDEHWTFTCTPLKIIIEAMEDLRRHAMLLAWLVGKTDFATAHGLPAGDKTARFKRLDEAELSDLATYYEELGNAPGNYYNSMNAHAAVQQIHLYRPADIESTVESYVRAVFALMLSDETRKFNWYMEPELSFNNLLCAAWSELAKGISQETGPGSIAVCKRCGKFFERRRVTKQYCSESCRVMATRDRAAGIEPAPDPEPTQIYVRRTKMREEAVAEEQRTDAMLDKYGLYEDEKGHVHPKDTIAF